MPAAAGAPILVAGAGIGGLAAAIALARSGYPVAVLERRAGLQETGAGVQLGPNAQKALAALGIVLGPADGVVRPEAIRVRVARTARTLAMIRLGATAEARFGAPYLCLHRNDLLQRLASTAARDRRISITLATSVVAATAGEHGGVALADGSGARMHGQALVGADGLWSVVRGAVETGTPVAARRSGLTAWRALIELDAVPPSLRRIEVGLWLGPEAHLVHYPVSGARLMNIVVVIADDSGTDDYDGTDEGGALTARLASWHAEPRALVAAATEWRCWRLHERSALRPWSRGAVTLLGDAAHPVLPFLAQGAALALEDAVVLGAAVARAPDLAAAFAAYEHIRRPRALRVQRASADNGRTYHLTGAGALARDLVLRATPGALMLERYRWLYGHSVLDD